MKRAPLAILFALLTSGCATSRPVPSPDGWPHYAISCRGGIEGCWEEGWNVCPRGYDVMDRGANVYLVPTANGPVAGQRNSMLVRCR